MIEFPPDITFVIQIVSFLVFWQLMKRLLFVPLQKVLEARTARTVGGRERAEVLKAEAAALTAELNAALTEARREGSLEAEVIRRRGEGKEQEIVDRSRAGAAALLERERATTSVQIEAARRALAADAERLADGVVAKVLGRAA